MCKVFHQLVKYAALWMTVRYGQFQENCNDNPKHSTRDTHVHGSKISYSHLKVSHIDTVKTCKGSVQSDVSLSDLGAGEVTPLGEYLFHTVQSSKHFFHCSVVWYLELTAIQVSVRVNSDREYSYVHVGALCSVYHVVRIALPLHKN